MPIVQEQKFDSELFGYAVGSCRITAITDSEISEIANSHFKLTYLKCDENVKVDLPCADEKTFLKMALHNFSSNAEEVEILDLQSKEDYDRLKDLALQSGEYSRFRTDPKFIHEEFEKLYTLWLDKSINGELADIIFVIRRNGIIGAFITLKSLENCSDIGLIAVDKDHRGESLGTALLAAAANWSIKSNKMSLSVTTQKRNEPAMNFYLKFGFQVQKTEYIYHIWKNENTI